MKQLLEIIDFHSGEVIVSVGVSGGVWEIGFGAEVDGLTFYLTELDPGLLNAQEVLEGVRFFEKQNNRPVQSTFIPLIGTSSTIPLPSGLADKLLLLNSLHEFSEPAAMAAECFRVLKVGGYLFVEEQLARYPGEQHEGCGKDLFLEEAMIRLMEKTGFKFRQKHLRDSSGFWKIFQFVRS